MQAVVFAGTRDVGVHEVSDAVVEEPNDVVVRVTSSAICGTDLHMYDGRTGATAGLVLGHEPLGVVEQVGSAVELVKAGDRVVIPTHLYCGVCVNCARGYSAACLRVRPGGFGAAYGYAGMGPYRGAQAELLRVPFADANCIPVPGDPGDDREDDFVLLADAFVTGWHATELAAVRRREHGGGVRRGRRRPAGGLQRAAQGRGRGLCGRRTYPSGWTRPGSWAPPRSTSPDGRSGRADPSSSAGTRGSRSARSPWLGCTMAIDAVGFQAHDRRKPAGEPTQVIEGPGPTDQPHRASRYRRCVRREGSPPGRRRAPDGRLTVPWATFFSKGVTVKFGRTHDRRYTTLLRDLIVSGRARPGVIVTHHGHLDNAAALYEQFDQRANGVIKAVLTP